MPCGDHDDDDLDFVLKFINIYRALKWHRRTNKQTNETNKNKKKPKLSKENHVIQLRLVCLIHKNNKN